MWDEYEISTVVGNQVFSIRRAMPVCEEDTTPYPFIEYELKNMLVRSLIEHLDIKIEKVDLSWTSKK